MSVQNNIVYQEDNFGNLFQPEDANLKKSGIIINDETVFTQLNVSAEIQLENDSIENTVIELKEEIARLKAEIGQKKTKASIKNALDNLNSQITAQKEGLDKLLIDTGDVKLALEALKNQHLEAKETIQNQDGDVKSLVERTNEENLIKKQQLNANTKSIWSTVNRTQAEVAFQHKYLANKVDLLPVAINAQKDLMPKLVETCKKINDQIVNISEYRNTSEHLATYNLNTCQLVNKDMLDKYNLVVDGFAKFFVAAHKDALDSGKELEEIAKKFEDLKTNFNEIKLVDSQFATLPKEEIYQAQKNTKTVLNALGEDEKELQSLYKEMVGKWNEIKSQHIELRTQIAMLESPLHNENLTIQWRYQITLPNSPEHELSLSPAATL